MSEEEFKINEPRPKRSETEIIKEKIKKANAVEFALKCSLITNKRNLDADNLFHISKGEYGFCTLTSAIPCKNPHCMTCNMLMLKDNLAEKIADFIGQACMETALDKIKDRYDEESESRFEQLKRRIEGDSNDE